MDGIKFPLHQAVRRLDLPRVEELAKSENVNVEDDDGHPPLWYAVEQLHESTAGNVASLLVSKGAIVQLHILFLCGVPDDDNDKALEMLRILLNSSPSLNINEADTSTGLTLLYVLAGSRLNKRVGFILGRGAHITKDERGRTPGHYALQPDRMREPLCKLHNLDIDQEDLNNMDRVMVTEVGVKAVHILLQLVKCGMDPDDADGDGQSLSNILGG
jgi:ankyrin repeat protein